MTSPPFDLSQVPRFLTPAELAAKEAAEAEAQQALQVAQTLQPPADEGTAESVSLDELAANTPDINRGDEGDEPGLDEPIDLELTDAAVQLIATSDTVDELFKAMLLAARQHADNATEHLTPSLGREYTRLTLAMESLRLMLADEDTADTLGPVAVGIIDHVTSEVQAWLDGSRAPYDGSQLTVGG